MVFEGKQQLGHTMEPSASLVTCTEAQVLTLRRGLEGAGDDVATGAVELEGEAGVRAFVEVLVLKDVLKSFEVGATDREQRFGAWSRVGQGTVRRVGSVGGVSDG